MQVGAVFCNLLCLVAQQVLNNLEEPYYPDSCYNTYFGFVYTSHHGHTMHGTENLEFWVKVDLLFLSWESERKG
jgi:hypothetical protein